MRLTKDQAALKAFLDKQYELYHQKKFISQDPISVPHQFSKQADIEIAGFFAAIFSWGNRKTIINKSNELMQLMHRAPHDFVLHHQAKDLKALYSFKHRTFNYDDLLYCIRFMQHHYQTNSSLETAFSKHLKAKDLDIENALNGFRNYFFSLEDFPSRTQKHISSPASGSTCKRLCMYLRWMVRDSKKGVDFGIWKQIKPGQLVMPLDVHVVKTAVRLGLLPHDKINWKVAQSLTEQMRIFDEKDPVKYDYALFGTSIMPDF